MTSYFDLDYELFQWGKFRRGGSVAVHEAANQCEIPIAIADLSRLCGVAEAAIEVECATPAEMDEAMAKLRKQIAALQCLRLMPAEEAQAKLYGYERWIQIIQWEQEERDLGRQLAERRASGPLSLPKLDLG